MSKVVELFDSVRLRYIRKSEVHLAHSSIFVVSLKVTTEQSVIFRIVAGIKLTTMNGKAGVREILRTRRFSC